MYLLTGENFGNFPYANSLVIEGSKRAVVDAGAGVGRLKPLAERGIDVLIFTHFHPDHGRDAYLFQGAQWWAHEADAPAISSVDGYKRFRHYHKPGKEYLLHLEQSRLGVYPYGPVAVQFRDGDWLDFGSIRLQVIHTPGHTPGHCCLYEPEMEILFSADIDASSFGPWYGDPVGDIDDFIASIQRVIDLNPKMLVPSHGLPITEGIRQKLEDYCSIIFQREEKILQFLRKKPGSLETLVGSGLIYRKIPEPDDLFRYFEATILEKHLRRLQSRGKVTVANGIYAAC